ncbi:MAG TPA: diphthine--ammonia ligase [Chondromyces sp.]|nr:diphthine--ammonia ligase [Chondromyces sp.]
MKRKVAVSWSGGKDCCMVLDHLINEGHEIAYLLTTLPKEIGRTFGHSEKAEQIQQQSLSLGIPVHFIHCTFESYTERFIQDLTNLKENHGVTAIAYGDLYLEGHREWGEKVAASAGIEAIYPLWSTEEQSLTQLKNFVNAGYKAIVIKVHNDFLDESWLGRELNETFIEDISKLPVCPMGEHGEFHTFVYDGPLFKETIPFHTGAILSLEHSKRLEIMAASTI